MTGGMIYSIAGAILVGIALYRLAVSAGTVRRLVAVNILSGGVASVLVASAYRGPGLLPDPVPHAFVLTGIVVLVAMTAAGLAIVRCIDEAQDE